MNGTNRLQNVFINQDKDKEMNIALRELGRQDLAEINKWRNDHEVIDLLGNNFLYIAKEVDEKWYDSYLQTRDQNKRLAIVDKDTNIIIGTIQLTGIHAVNRTAEYSIMIGNKAYWGRGAGLTASIEILKHGFCDLNLNRIYLTVLAGNERAIKLYKKIGFTEEGLQREAIYKSGKFHDLIQMSILKKEFKQ